MDLEGEIARLRAEVESLKAKVDEAGSVDGGNVGGFGPDMGLPIVPIGGGGEYGTFRYEEGKITNCTYFFGRNVYTVSDVENVTPGLWSLVVRHTNPSGGTVECNTAERTSLTQTVVPLFWLSEEGEVTIDYRGAPVITVRE